MLAFTAAVASRPPAWCSALRPPSVPPKTEPGAAIKSGGRSLTEGRERFSVQRLLVVVQISVSLVLVVGALLFVGSFRNLMTLDPGFREKGISVGVLRDVVRPHKLPDAQAKSFERQLLEEVRSIPQVEAAATTTNILIDGGSWSLGIRAGSVEDVSKFTWVSPGHFKTLETPPAAGRDFSETDTATSPKVAIVNQTLRPPLLRRRQPDRQNVPDIARAELSGDRVPDCRRHQRHQVLQPA